jgi:hypothetical protein
MYCAKNWDVPRTSGAAVRKVASTITREEDFSNTMEEPSWRRWERYDGKLRGSSSDSCSELESCFNVDNVSGTKKSGIRATRLAKKAMKAETHGENASMQMEEIAGPTEAPTKLANARRKNVDALFYMLDITCSSKWVTVRAYRSDWTTKSDAIEYRLARSTVFPPPTTANNGPARMNSTRMNLGKPITANSQAKDSEVPVIERIIMGFRPTL